MDAEKKAASAVDSDDVDKEKSTDPKSAKASNAAFMPAALRLKRHGITKPKPKARRSEDQPPPPPPAEETPSETDATKNSTVANPAPTPRLPLGECRSVDCYARLNLIAESQHGIVYRARNKQTGSIVALKKFKNRKEPDGFPITFLREINILFTMRHPNIITADEVVCGGNDDDLNWFLVIEYVDHDLKDLITTMKTPFLEGQVT